MNNAANASNTGKGFEALLAKVFAAYYARGIARIEKVEPPVKVIRRPGCAPRVIMLENPFLDFSGVWTAQGGRAIHVEAKSTAEPRLSIVAEGKTGSGISDNQARAAVDWRMAGAAVGFLWLHASDVRLVTVETLAAERSRKSIAWSEALPIPQGPGLIIYDFLSLLTPRAASGTVVPDEENNPP